MSDSAYGTFDQGGNVAEWNEALVSAGHRGVRGGDWSNTVTSLASATRGNMVAAIENGVTGFRLATVPPVVPVPGDYNANGTVDAADYVLWRNHLGTSTQLQNEVSGTTPGMVTQEDYDAWRARFGNIAGAGSGSAESAAVPEPAGAVLFSFVAVIAAVRRSRSGFSLTIQRSRSSG